MQLFSAGGGVAAAFYYDDAGRVVPEARQRTDLRYDYDSAFARVLLIGKPDPTFPEARLGGWTSSGATTTPER